MNLELIDELRAASTKLNYLIGLCDQEDENKHRQVILKKYIKEIEQSIKEVSDKITEAYDSIHECELSDDSDTDYTELYLKLADQAKKDRQFIEDFGLSVVMWHMIT
jgi:hypothetical protein